MKMKNSDWRYSAAMETIRSNDSDEFKTTGNRMHESAPSPRAFFGRALVISSIRLTGCTSGNLTLMRRSRSFNWFGSTPALKRNICIVPIKPPTGGAYVAQDNKGQALQ
jgi:hypothetical protein